MSTWQYRLHDATIIQGDASKESVLDREHIEKADAFISMTGMDELNVITSLYANELKVPKVVTKLGRGENISLIANMPVGSVITPMILCGKTILRYVRAMQNGSDAAETLHSIAGGKSAGHTSSRWNEDTWHCNEPLKDIDFKKNILLATITRDRKIEFPGGNSYFQPGDRVMVASNGSMPIIQLNDIFEEDREEGRTKTNARSTPSSRLVNTLGISSTRGIRWPLSDSSAPWRRPAPCPY